MTGGGIGTVIVGRGTKGVEINFTLKSDAATNFANYTSTHIGQVLAIVLDKKVISAPVITQAIPDGRGSITGNFTSDSANALAIELRYGSLPVPIKVVKSETVGPTLGEESDSKYLIAGAIRLLLVVLYMGLYYH